MGKVKKRWIALDADYLVFKCTEGVNVKMSMFKSENCRGVVSDKQYKEPLKPYKDKFKMFVQEVEDAIAANHPGEVRGIKVFLSDPDTNFRYGLFPKYKGNRPSSTRSELFYRLRKWASKKYGHGNNIEADDKMGYYVGVKNYFGASMDKDCLRGVAGDWYDVYHSRETFHTTSILEARNFIFLQTLMGDPGDGIPALPKEAGIGMIPLPDIPKGTRQPFKVTEKLAIKLLDDYGWDWNGVRAAYSSKGLTEDDAILNRRLVGLDQWTPKGGVKLFKPTPLSQH